jgi:paraquat-inducible protein A
MTIPRSALSQHVIGCHACGLAHALSDADEVGYCTRCDTRIHARKHDSIRRTWAFLAAAIILYVPAMALPVMHTNSLKGNEDDTILQGVAYFWNSGSWGLAMLIFIASVLVPLLKISSLTLLNVTVQRRTTWASRQRASLYRVVEFIGPWSMLDVFVVTLTVTLVRFHSLAEIAPRGGIMAFGSVVVLTMFASMSFDPRLIWDATEASS